MFERLENAKNLHLYFTYCLSLCSFMLLVNDFIIGSLPPFAARSSNSSLLTIMQLTTVFATAVAILGALSNNANSPKTCPLYLMSRRTCDDAEPRNNQTSPDVTKNAASPLSPSSKITSSATNCIFEGKASVFTFLIVTHKFLTSLRTVFCEHPARQTWGMF